MADKLNPFYDAQDGSRSTHLALHWKGRLRFVVPESSAAQAACWAVFQPGRLGIALRLMARNPRLPGVTRCIESATLAWIRSEIGIESGASCLRTGADSSWHKDTILLVNKESGRSDLVIKAGAVDAVDALLENESNWLRYLGGKPEFEGLVPRLVASGTNKDVSFMAQTAVSGDVSFSLGEAQLEFLRRLQSQTLEEVQLEETAFWRTLNDRVGLLSFVLPASWALRFERALSMIAEALSGSRLVVTAAHNDFTGWNIKLDRGVAKVFDWEYAAFQQLPLFDPLHFNLAPMGLRSESLQRMESKLHETLAICATALRPERCYRPREQALAYLVNLCTLYMSADRGTKNSHPTLVRYGALIDKLCDV